MVYNRKGITFAADFKIKGYTGMNKKKVSQDFLYDIITRNGVNMTTLAELMGMSPTMVSGCFKHQKDATGKPRNFPARTIPRLNEAIAQLSEQLAQTQIAFGSSEAYTNNRGVEYDPATVEPIMALHRYFKLTKFLNNALGWSQNKKSIVLHTPSSKGYACVSKKDVERINAAITEVSILLSGIEVESADGSSNSI